MKSDDPMDPEPELNDLDEEPTDFEKHGDDLLAAMLDALKRGAHEEAKRIQQDLQEHNEKTGELLEEKQDGWFEEPREN